MTSNASSNIAVCLFTFVENIKKHTKKVKVQTIFEWFHSNILLKKPPICGTIKVCQTTKKQYTIMPTSLSKTMRSDARLAARYERSDNRYCIFEAILVSSKLNKLWAFGKYGAIYLWCRWKNTSRLITVSRKFLTLSSSKSSLFQKKRVARPIVSRNSFHFPIEIAILKMFVPLAFT